MGSSSTRIDTSETPLSEHPESSYKEKMTMRRDSALDGLRGIAALCVVLSHIAAMTWVPFVDRRPPGMAEWILWNLGAPAVDVFFVLSGYVVTKSIIRRDPGYGEYVLSRMVRLYPVAWIAVCMGLVLRHAGLHPLLGMSGSFEIMRELTNSDVMGLATLIVPIPDVNKVNAPLWTIVLEMQMVFALPLLARASRHNPMAVGIAGLLLPFLLVQATGYIYPIFYTGFILGAALAGTEHRIPEPPRSSVVLAFFVAALLVRHAFDGGEYMRVPCAVAATGVILAIRKGAARGVLQTRALQWLGSISYPLYAVHWVIMTGFTMYLGGRLGIATAALASIPVSLMAAWVIDRIVDRPAVRLSSLLRSQ